MKLIRDHAQDEWKRQARIDFVKNVEHRARGNWLVISTKQDGVPGRWWNTRVEGDSEALADGLAAFEEQGWIFVCMMSSDHMVFRRKTIGPEL